MIAKGKQMLLRFILALSAAIAVASVITLLGSLPTAKAEAPVLTYSSVEEGDVLEEPPFVLQLCFRKPINILDLDKGGDFRFRVRPSDNFPLGLRVVFQRDGYGVAVYPGTRDRDLAGEWTLEWRVTSPEELEPAEGTIAFSVDPEGEPVSKEVPPPCTKSGLPAGTPQPDEMPSASPTPAGVRGEDEGGGGGDVLLLSLLAAGIIVPLLGLAVYRLRRRSGGAGRASGN